MRNKIISATVIILVLSAVLWNYIEQQEETIVLTEQIKSARKEISVYVSGQVQNPAVINFEDDENLKCVDAVNAAGGLTDYADTSAVNLAKPLVDGQHIHIPTKKIILQNTDNAKNDLININTADEEELQKIKGVGSVTAKRIIDYRESNGKFETIEDLKNVRGISEKKFEKIKEFISVH